MDVAALLLTGGASRRMGRDKATLAGPDGRTLAERTAALLSAVAVRTVEVGRGVSGAADVVADADPGAGPLAAVATGAAALQRLGWTGPALVVATDLPGLEVAMLAWLAAHAAPGTVVPVVDDRDQLLCARLDPVVLADAGFVVARGRRRMTDLLDGRDVHRAGPDEWRHVCPPSAWGDVDTPADLARAWPSLLPGVPGRGPA